MKRTEKSKANSRQSKPKDYDRDKGEVRGETQHRGKLQPASPEASKNRCRCPAAATRAEALRSDRDHPKDRLRREIGDHKKIIQTAQKQRLRKYRRP